MSGTIGSEPQPTGTRQWLRYANIVLTGDGGKRLAISDLQFSFEVRQFDNQTPNTAFMTVHNLSETTANLIKQEYTKVALWVGYQSNFGPVFEGTVRQFRYGRETATDTYFEIRAGDGDIAYIQSVISVTLAAGSTAQDALAAVLRALEPYGITRGYIAALPDNRAPRALVLVGMVRDVMRELAQTWNMLWSIQAGKLVVVPLAGYALPGQAIVLNSASGLIGMPEQTIEGISIRCLINPQIVPGRTVKIWNGSIQRARADLSYLGEVRNALQDEIRIADDGLYRVIAVDHVGDTRGDKWYSEIIAIALGDNISIPQAARGRT